MKPPNVLWICSDQQRWDTLGCYGNPHVRTPNLDRLAREGVLFTHAFSQSTLCQPSRASFLTGRYPVTTRLRQNGQDMPAEEAEHLVTRILADQTGQGPAGDAYVCGLVGKLHLSACNHRRLMGPEWWKLAQADQHKGGERRLDDGYAVFDWDHACHYDNPASEYARWLHDRGVTVRPEPHPDCPYILRGMPSEHHQATWCAERAIRFMEMCAGKSHPWLMSVNIFDPHPVYDPPAEYLDRYRDILDTLPLPNYVEGEKDAKPAYHRRYEASLPGGSRQAVEQAGRSPGFAGMTERDHRWARAAYLAMCDHLDVQVGRMLEALERTGQRDNTIVIYMSDHGETVGDHGHYPKGPFVYDPAVRVPLIVRGPGVQAGVTTDALVELTDLAPALLEAAGRPRAPGMQGRSLWPLLTGEAPADRFRDDVYCEYYNANPDRQPIWLTMLRTQSHKLVAVHSDDGHYTGEGELYDLEADPTEIRNLWSSESHLGLKADLLARLAARLAFTADPLPPRIGIF